MSNLWSLKKFTCAYLFQTAGENLCDYVLIIEMEKKEIAYHYADALACASSAKVIYSKPANNICVQSKQLHTIKTIGYNDIFPS